MKQRESCPKYTLRLKHHFAGTGKKDAPCPKFPSNVLEKKQESIGRCKRKSAEKPTRVGGQGARPLDDQALIWTSLLGGNLCSNREFAGCTDSGQKYEVWEVAGGFWRMGKHFQVSGRGRPVGARLRQGPQVLQVSGKELLVHLQNTRGIK
ncbi:hypothetical protein M5K25_027203 [Dendrobium thyrsiflorum]|uniref:Uncharacterized protein n=1 Tax=Dendrobium thyrsiflorum TaxID=117978 RepID=A0ABD0TZA0_DENTH